MESVVRFSRLAVSLLALAACGTSVTPPTAPTVTPAIVIGLDRQALTISAGEATQPIRIALVRAGSATGPVDLAVTGLPAGVRASFTPAQLTGAAASSVMELTATTTAAASTTNATVQATSGTLSSTVAFSLTVRRP
jgi:hypothetical protein